MKVAYQLNNETPVIEQFSENLNAGSEIKYTFSTTVSEPQGYYTLKVYIELTGDQNPNNNSQTVDFIYYPELTLYGYRISDNFIIDPLAVVSFSTYNPKNVTVVSNYADGSNYGQAGEYFDKHLYLFTRHNETSGNFVKLSTENWSAVSSTPVSMMTSDMTYDYTTNTMYGVAYTMGANQLVTIDMETGEITIVGVAEYFNALACSLSGILYGVSSVGMFCSIDKTTGTITEIGATGESPLFLQSMAFDHKSGRLLWAMCNFDDEGKLMEIDVTTGKAWGHGTIGGEAEIVALYTPYTPAGIPNTELQATKFKIYPNPAKEQVCVQRSSSEKTLIEIYNSNGKLVQSLESSKPETTLNISSLASGIYMIRLICNQTTSSQLFVKE
jgi:hypothetical protein